MQDSEVQDNVPQNRYVRIGDSSRAGYEPSPPPPHNALSPSTPQRHQQPLPPPPEECNDYFSSTNARIDYGYLNPSSNEDKERPVLDILIERTRRFYRGAEVANGWKDVLEDSDINNLMDNYHIHQIKYRCFFLYKALTIFINKKRKNQESTSFEKCCREAIAQVKSEREETIELINEDSTGKDEYTCDVPSVSSMKNWMR